MDRKAKLKLKKIGTTIADKEDTSYPNINIAEINKKQWQDIFNLIKKIFGLTDDENKETD